MEAPGGSRGVCDHPGVKGRDRTPSSLPVGDGRRALCSHTAPCQACRDFLALAEAHSRKWQRALQYEQEQRIHLEETIEQLAKQHNSLERAFRNSLPSRAADPNKSFNEGEHWAWPGHSTRSLPPGRWLCSQASLCPPWACLATSGWPLPGFVSHASHHLATVSLKDKFRDPTVPFVPGLTGSRLRLGVVVPWEGQKGQLGLPRLTSM